MKHKGTCQNVNQYLGVSSSLIFEGTFAAFPLNFSLLNSPVKPRNSRFCNLKVIGLILFIVIIFQIFFTLDILKHCFLKMLIRERPKAN